MKNTIKRKSEDRVVLRIIIFGRKNCIVNRNIKENQKN